MCPYPSRREQDEAACKIEAACSLVRRGGQYHGHRAAWATCCFKTACCFSLFGLGTFRTRPVTARIVRNPSHKAQRSSMRVPKQHSGPRTMDNWVQLRVQEVEQLPGRLFLAGYRAASIFACCFNLCVLLRKSRALG